MEEDTTTNGTERPRLPPKEAIEPQLIIESTIVIDRQFRDLMDPLTDNEYALLKANIERDGQREPIVVWESDDGRELTIIDGHNRHRACKELGRDTLWVAMPFDDAAHAKRWIFEQHRGRRNSTLAQFRKVLAALDAADEKRKAAAARKVAGRAPEAPSPDGRVSPGERAPTVHEEIAKEQGVSRNLVDQMALIEKHPDLVAKVERGEMTPEKAASAARMRMLNNDPDPKKAAGKKRAPKKAAKPTDIIRNCRTELKIFSKALDEKKIALNKTLNEIDDQVAAALVKQLEPLIQKLEDEVALLRATMGTLIKPAAASDPPSADN